MDLAIFTLEDLKDSNSAFVAITPLGSANVGVSTTCEILQHHHLASWADHFSIHKTVSDGLYSANHLQLITKSIRVQAAGPWVWTRPTVVLADDRTDHLQVRTRLLLMRVAGRRQDPLHP